MKKTTRISPQTLSCLSFQLGTYASIATKELQCLVNRLFTLHLSLFWNECLSVFQSCILFFRQTFSYFKPLLVQCWKETCVCVCISPTWLCRKTVWMRSQHAVDRQHLHCKGLFWLSPLARPCCFHGGRGSDWGVVASAGQQMFSSLKESRDGLRNKLWWSNQNDKFDSLDEGPQFVEQIAERWRDWMPCGLIF